MSGPASRRGFLRDLVGLPLIGGGLTLIGAPSAVAAPVTPDLMANYESWLAMEARAVSQELRPGYPPGSVTTLYTDAWRWHHDGAAPPPSTRAALVLSTVGCGWGGYSL